MTGGIGLSVTLSVPAPMSASFSPSCPGTSALGSCQNTAVLMGPFVVVGGEEQVREFGAELPRRIELNDLLQAQMRLMEVIA